MHFLKFYCLSLELTILSLACSDFIEEEELAATK
jgi:hypothetical protein